MKTNTSAAILNKQKAKEAKNQEALKNEAIKVKEKLENMVFEFKVKAGQDGKVFGSISTKQIVERLDEEGIKIDKRKIIDTQPINVLGTTIIKVELYKDVIGNVKCHLVEE